MSSEHWNKPFLAAFIICSAFVSFALIVRATAVAEISIDDHSNRLHGASDVDLSIAKAVTPSMDVVVGGVVTYSIELENRDDGPAIGVVMTDRLPGEVTFGDWLEQNGAIRSHNMITWSGDVPARSEIGVQFTTTVGAYPSSLGLLVTNTASFSSTNAGTGSDDVAFVVVKPPKPVVTYTIHLPLVSKNLFYDPYEPNGTVAQAYGPLASGQPAPFQEVDNG